MSQFGAYLTNFDQVCALKSFQTLKKEENPEKEGRNSAITQHPVPQAFNLQSRSRKKISQLNYEISFQSGILDSHIAAFEVFFGKYWENGCKNSQPTEIKLVQNFIPPSSNCDYAEWIDSQLQSLPNLLPAQKLQLIEDWRKEQNLCKFLKLITEKLQPVLKPEIISLAIFIWQQYLKVPSFKWGEEQKIKKILESVIQQSGNIYSLASLKYLTFEAANEEGIRESFTEFLSNFAETLYLVIEGYFENPLHEAENRERRRFSSVDWEELYEEDSYLMGLPNKMPKLT